MRIGGEKYQQAFYVFEEMAQTPSNSSSTKATKSLVAQGVAEIHLGRLPEADAALEQALGRDGEDVQTLANSVVLGTIAGRETAALSSTLRRVAPEHPFLVDLKEKSALFDQAARKYKARVAS